MSKRTDSHVVPIIAACGMMALMVACASSGQSLATNATSSISDTQDELMITTTQIEKTMETLNALVHQSGDDMLEQYDLFVNQLAGAENKREKLHEQTVNMQQEGDAYFQAWEQELTSFTNPVIRRRSEERRTAVLKHYQQMISEVEAILQSFNPFLSDLKDIERHLEIDLTLAGISSIKQVVDQANGDAATLQNRIGVALDAIDRMAAEMSPSKGPGTNPPHFATNR